MRLSESQRRARSSPSSSNDDDDEVNVSPSPLSPPISPPSLSSSSGEEYSNLLPMIPSMDIWQRRKINRQYRRVVWGALGGVLCATLVLVTVQWCMKLMDSIDILIATSRRKSDIHRVANPCPRLTDHDIVRHLKKDSESSGWEDSGKRGGVFVKLVVLLGDFLARLFGERANDVTKNFMEYPSGFSSRSKLVIAGKMNVEGLACNIAQLDLNTGAWDHSDRVQLNLYNSYSGGEVYDLLSNHTNYNSAEDEGGGAVASINSEVDKGEKLIVVGAFDTTYKNNQVIYCSVGKWDGSDLSKVGEGLCNSALSKGMKITTAALAGPQDVYVAGSFHTQVWNGDMHQFVQIYNVAHYNAIEKVWLPLPSGQIDCSWCTVTIMALAWDLKREQLHIAGKFNSINGGNIPAGLAIYDNRTRRLVAHPGGGLCMVNVTEDGVGTSLQLDQESDVLYVMGSFERLTATGEICFGLAAYEIAENRWTCLADAKHTVLPSGGGNMLLTPYGLMVSGLTTNSTTWNDPTRPYTIALLQRTLKKQEILEHSKDKFGSASTFDHVIIKENTTHIFNWSWLPGFPGHNEPLHVLSNGFAEYEGTVFIGGDNLVAKWTIKDVAKTQLKGNVVDSRKGGARMLAVGPDQIPITTDLSSDRVTGQIMTVSQLIPPKDEFTPTSGHPTYRIVAYCLMLGSLIGIFIAVMFNKNLNRFIISLILGDSGTGISLDTLTYSTVQNTSVGDAYQNAMKKRRIPAPRFITLINPQEIILHRIIGEGTFGRVWSAKWRSSSVAVKEFVFAQAAVTGKSSMQKEIIEEIIGEAGMMAILRHPHVLQLYGCSLTAQAIWIVSELCSMGSLRQLLDDTSRDLPIELRLKLALHVAEGMTYLHTQDPPIIHRDLKSHNIFVQETYNQPDANQRKKDHKRNRKKEVSPIKYSGLFNGNSKSKYGSIGTHKKKSVPNSTIVAKIGDWGSARAALSGSRTMTHGIGTACWLAPEVIKHARSSKHSDVYSFGIVLWELATREEVYKPLETTQIIAKVANDNLRPPVPEGCLWKSLMVKCWDENPNRRPSFDVIVNELSQILKSCHSVGDGVRGESFNSTSSREENGGSVLRSCDNPNEKSGEIVSYQRASASLVST